jgi:hypothetical protein
MALKRTEKIAIDRVSALIVANAMIFQEVLSQKDRRVNPLRSLSAESDLIASLGRHWQFILDEINYHPIFRTAVDLLNKLPADESVEKSVRELLTAASRIVSWRAALRHDLAGRIFHRLLRDAKYLGAYYTKVSSAVLLLKLALQPEEYDCDWSDIDSISRLRVADFACGTGTLLMAAADVVLDNYVRAAAIEGDKPELRRLHKAVLEKVTYGFDVLQSAIHLTASTLMLRAPDDPVAATNLHTLSFGGSGGALGSLELLTEPSFANIAFDVARRVTARGEAPVENGSWVIPALDLCVMNPPFTSSRRANLLFGSLPSDERKRMQERLKRVVREQKIPASVTAGLAAVFTAMADQYVKPGGHLALVLPRSSLSGVSWAKTRKMLAERFRVRYVVASHEPRNWNFSENTSLSEVLLVAQKTGGKDSGKDGDVVCVNLWRNTSTPAEGLAIAKSVSSNGIPPLSGGPAVREVSVGDQKFGETFLVPWKTFRAQHWDRYFAFAQTGLVRALDGLERGGLRVPNSTKTFKVPLTPLQKLCTIGYDPRDVFDAFDVAHGRTGYPTVWGHKSDEMRSMKASPNAYLRPLVKAREGRGLRDADHLWKKAGRILVAQRLRLNTARVTSVRLSERVLCNVWWSLSLTGGSTLAQREKALVLWFNSTLGLLLLLGRREETEGSYMQFKKPVLGDLLVMDVEALTPAQLSGLESAYKRLCSEQLQSFSRLATDPVRRLIDDAIATALGLPTLDTLRAQLGAEPLLAGVSSRLTGTDDEADDGGITADEEDTEE